MASNKNINQEISLEKDIRHIIMLMGHLRSEHNVVMNFNWVGFGSDKAITTQLNWVLRPEEEAPKPKKRIIKKKKCHCC